jgi:hypothetical protein
VLARIRAGNDTDRIFCRVLVLGDEGCVLGGRLRDQYVTERISVMRGQSFERLQMRRDDIEPNEPVAGTGLHDCADLSCQLSGADFRDDLPKTRLRGGRADFRDNLVM